MFKDQIEKAKAYLAEHPNLDAALWFVPALACVVILVWFLLFSGFSGAPEFIYDQF